jgi:hypothetical protein
MFSLQMLYHHRGASVPRHFTIAKIANNTIFSLMHCKVLPQNTPFFPPLPCLKIQAVVALTTERGRLAVGAHEA